MRPVFGLTFPPQGRGGAACRTLDMEEVMHGTSLVIRCAMHLIHELFKAGGCRRSGQDVAWQPANSGGGAPWEPLLQN